MKVVRERKLTQEQVKEKLLTFLERTKKREAAICKVNAGARSSIKKIVKSVLAKKKEAL